MTWLVCAEISACLEAFPEGAVRVCTWHKARSIRPKFKRYLSEEAVQHQEACFWGAVKAKATPDGEKTLLEMCRSSLEALAATEETIKFATAGIQGTTCCHYIRSTTQQ